MTILKIAALVLSRATVASQPAVVKPTVLFFTGIFAAAWPITAQYYFSLSSSITPGEGPRELAVYWPLPDFTGVKRLSAYPGSLPFILNAVHSFYCIVSPYKNLHLYLASDWPRK